MVFAGYYAFINGKPEYYLNPYDQFGAPCGLEAQADFPYLYFIKTGPYNVSLKNTVCLTSCPDANTKRLTCAPNYYDKGYDCYDLEIYETIAFYDTFCLPSDVVTTAQEAASKHIKFSVLLEAISDIKTTWWMILVVGGIALISGFIFLFLMKMCAGIVIWLFILLFLGLLIVVGTVCLQDKIGVDLGEITPNDMERLSPEHTRYIGYGCFGFAALYFLIVCCMRERINLAIAVLKAAADFVEDESGVLFIPPLIFIKSVAFYISWIFAFIYIIGLNDIKPHAEHYPVADIDINREGGAIMGYYLFGLLWNHAFDSALCQFIICSTVCVWYFNNGRGDNPKAAVWTSVKRSIRHLGSIALGSFLIALLDLIRIIMNYIAQQVKRAPGGDNPAVNFAICCCNCLLSCFERFIKFINRHAYVHIAMTGENFCEASVNSFSLVLRNAGRFGIVHGLGSFSVFIGEIFISALATLIGYFVITQEGIFHDRIHDPIAPCTLFFLHAYIVSKVFMGVYGVAADTIIHCFAMDEEMHDGHAQCAPEKLRDFADNNLPKKLLDHPDR
jgi:hypothetical protein